MNFGKLVGIAACAGLVFATGPAHASCKITVNGVVSGTYGGTTATIPILPGETLSANYDMPLPGGLCGAKIEAPTGTCAVNLDIATSTQSTANADCLTIDEGVTIIGNNHEIVCSVASGTCGKGVRVLSSGGSSDKVEVKDLEVRGEWATGIRGESGNNFIVNRVTVDLEGGGTNGIAGAVKEINDSLVTNGTGDCVAIGSNNVTNCQISFCDGHGIYTAEPQVITNSFIHDNGMAFEVNVSSTHDITLTSSVVYDNGCNTYFDFYNICSNSLANFDIDSTWIDLTYHP